MNLAQSIGENWVYILVSFTDHFPGAVAIHRGRRGIDETLHPGPLGLVCQKSRSGGILDEVLTRGIIRHGVIGQTSHENHRIKSLEIPEVQIEEIDAKEGGAGGKVITEYAQILYLYVISSGFKGGNEGTANISGSPGN